VRGPGRCAARGGLTADTAGEAAYGDLRAPLVVRRGSLAFNNGKRGRGRLRVRVQPDTDVLASRNLEANLATPQAYVRNAGCRLRALRARRLTDVGRESRDDLWLRRTLSDFLATYRLK
jgi:hypothetical protein